MTDIAPSTAPIKERSQLYTRQASGLVRNISSTTLFGLALGAMLPTSFYFLAGGSITLFPGSDFAVPLLLGGLFAGLIMIPYHQLVAAFPRSGGDYVFASRIFGPLVGAFVGGCVLGVFLLLLVALGAYLYTAWLPVALQILGLVFAKSTFNRWAADIPSSHTTEFIVSLVFLLLVMGAAMLPTRRALAVIFWSFALCTLGGILLLVQFVIHSNADLQHAFNAYSTPNAYNNILAAAHKANIPSKIIGSAVIAAIPLGIFNYTGLTFGVYTAGEIKSANKTFRNASFAAVAFITIFVVISYLAMRHFVSYKFLAGASGLNQADPATYAKYSTAPTSFGGVFYGALTADPVTRIIVALSFLSGLFSAALATFLPASRLLFAFSFDRLLPRWVADVNPRLSSPVNALVVVFVLAVALAVLSIYTTALTVVANALLVFCVFWFASSLAAALLPYIRPELYAASPKMIGGKIAGVPMITIASGLSAVICVVLFVVVARNHAFSGNFPIQSIIALAVIGLFGPVAYFIAKVRLQRTEGIDLDLAMKELPPE
ncbi:MAG TPA: APC family permease [Solirubrobacteraceae bacterium]|nr:APC family permease [Solirubrobacteraceae bacterium]